MQQVGNAYYDVPIYSNILYDIIKYLCNNDNAFCLDTIVGNKLQKPLPRYIRGLCRELLFLFYAKCNTWTSILCRRK